MKRTRFTDEQIIGILKEHEAGTPVSELCRKHGVSDASIYKWGQNKSSPKSYAKAERNRNDVVVRMCNIRFLWIAIDMRQF